VSSALNVTGYFCRFPLMLHSLFQEVYPFLAFLLVEVLGQWQDFSIYWSRLAQQSIAAPKGRFEEMRKMSTGIYLAEGQKYNDEYKWPCSDPETIFRRAR
jgi:hypothetical protein